MKQTTKFLLTVAVMAVTLSCVRNDGQKPEIKVDDESLSIISSGVNLEATGNSGHVQTVMFRFTATDNWSASFTGTKPDGWITLEPSIGTAGDVTMTIIVQDNTGSVARSAIVTIKCVDAIVQFMVTQAGALPTVIEVTGITLDRENVTIVENESITLVAEVTPEDAADPAVVWSSSDATVATVDQNGKVTAVSPGTATITAAAGDVSATCAVTVKAVYVFSIDPASVSISEEGGTFNVAVTCTDGDYHISSKPDWVVEKSVNNKVHTFEVSKNSMTDERRGVIVFCDDVGTCIPCEVRQAAASVIKVTSITLNKTSISLEKGSSETLTATVNPSDATDKSVSWTSSDATVASVDQSGRVTAMKGGKATITAQAGEKTATCEVTVTVSVESVTLNRTSVTLEEGQTTTLTATVNPSDATDKSVTWSSSDATVASVDQSGKVTAHKAGSAEITAKAGGKSAKCTVTVSKKIVSVTSITLNKTSLTLEIGETETLTASVLPENATNKEVTWTSNNESVATVSSTGVVTAVSPGAATITVTTADGGKTATCSVTVQQPTFNGGDIEGTEDDTWN